MCAAPGVERKPCSQSEALRGIEVAEARGVMREGGWSRNVPVATAVLDRALVFQLVTESWSKLFVLPSGDLVGHSFHDVFLDPDGNWQRQLLACLEGRDLAGVDEVVRPDNSRLRVLWTMQPSRASNGLVSAVIMTSEPEPTATLDISPSLVALRDALRDLAARDLLAGDRAAMSRSIASSARVVVSADEGEIVFEDTDSSVAPAPRTIAILLRGDGRTIGTLCLARAEGRPEFSPVEHVLAEVVAEQAAILLRVAEMSRQARNQIHEHEEMLAIVSHDLKTPLNAISLREQQLARLKDPRLAAHTQMVRHWVSEARQLIRGLLDVSAITRGQLQIHSAEVDVAGLLVDVAEMFRDACAEEGLELEMVVPPKLRATIDRDRMFQVLANLVSNAVKHTSRGGRIRLEVEPRDGRVIVTVSDTGSGIAPDVLPHVFERFFTTTSGWSGTGLGLYIAKHLVEAHGGTISITSEPDRGTRVTLALPGA
ncbi:MAG: ATP-binding protein [Kofleriaceae bacterium]